MNSATPHQLTDPAPAGECRFVARSDVAFSDPEYGYD